MLGSQLLVAPIFAENGDVDFYLPAGKRTSFFTEEMKQGPRWFQEKHGFDTLPLYVREGCILVLGNTVNLRSELYMIIVLEWKC